MTPSELQRLSLRASKLYFVARRVKKEDGSERVLYDTRQPLKHVLQSINKHFLKRVHYPEYLTGGLPGTDYKKNVDKHAGAATVIKEDITKFFPSVGDAVVYDVWSGFFGFAPEVADLMTKLTTRDGHLEQGAPTSGYLANLALWDVEPTTVKRLAETGWPCYTRHVDDICASSKEPRDSVAQAWAVTQIYGMLRAKNLHAKREKHRVMHSNAPIVMLKLVGNEKASLPKEQRARIRAAAHQYLLQAAKGENVEALLAGLPRILGQVHTMKRFHPGKGAKLAQELNAAATRLREDLFARPPAAPQPGKAVVSSDEPPPWD
jgi:hypothetical protein